MISTTIKAGINEPLTSPRVAFYNLILRANHVYLLSIIEMQRHMLTSRDLL